MPHRKFIVLTAALFVLLTACQPAAAPTQAALEEVIVVTQTVEGESVEVLTSSAGDPAQLAVPPQTGRMVIKDAEIELLVNDTDTSIASVTQLAADYGGYIISSQSRIDRDYKYATIRLAVPSAAFESALNNLRLFSREVLAETASGQDVSAEYVDLETRLQNLEATAARVRSFLDAAQTVEESLEVSAELSKLEAEIEQIKGQMRYYEGRTAYSTITVQLTPHIPPVEVEVQAWTPLRAASESGEQFVEIAQHTIDILIWLVMVPGPFLLAGWLVYTLVYRRRRTRHPEAAA